MCDVIKDVRLPLTVMVNKEKNKVVYAVADNHFTDILLSFLTLPLGKMVKVLEKHDAASTIGSLSSLYHGLADLDSSHFVTEAAKNSLLYPMSSFEAEHERLKLDIIDYQPAPYLCCTKCTFILRSVSLYYDRIIYCHSCKARIGGGKEIVERRSGAASGYDVFTIHSTSFIISDDLLILPNESGFSRIISFLGISDTEMDKAEPMTVDLGLSEILDLLKASLSSPTPLSDVILKKTVETVNWESQPMIAKELQNSDCKFILKVMIQKSRGKLLYAEANEKLIEFLFSLVIIPLGGAQHLLAGNGKTCSKAINNLYRSVSDLIDDKYFKTETVKNRLISLNLPHGYISENYMLPLTEESLPTAYIDHLSWFYSDKFPKGKGRYLREPRTYEVKDDLAVTPFCFASVHARLREQKIKISDVKEVELQIGLKEGLGILKASLTSTTALTDALLSQIPNKQPKREADVA